MPVFSFLLWLLLTWGAGWLFFPLSRRLFETVLPESGLEVGRILFLALWTLASFWLGFAHVPIAWSAGLYLPMALMGLWLWRRDTSLLRQTLTEKRRTILSAEAIFLGVFLVFFVLRGYWSDTNGNNGEKGMDGILVAALTRADHLPPPNPYAAGSRLQSYYYTGHLSAALLSRASFASNRWTYNWMCATIPALCFSTLFALGAALTGRLLGGAFVAGSVLVLGTLHPFFQWTHQTVYSPNQFLRLDFFGVSRVIPYTINEFPWFTLNQADLHAHYFSFSLQIALMTLAWALFRHRSRGLIALTALVLGALVLTNTWDFPVYTVLIWLALVCASKAGAFRRFGVGIAIAFAALVVALPFLYLLKSTAAPPRLLEQPASPLREWLLMWGPIGGAWWLYSARFIAIGKAAFWRPVLGAAAAWTAISWFATDWAPVGQSSRLVLPLILLSMALAVVGLKRLRDEWRFLCVLALAGLAALLWSETTWAGFLGEPGHTGFDDFKRQDTVFKFGLQCWFLWGTASACGIWFVLGRVREWQKTAIMSLYAPLVAVMLMASMAVTWGRCRGFSRWDGWDGWAHLAPTEKEAASWLQSTAGPNDYLLEAEMKEGGDFTDYPRFAHATGISTVVGPLSHSFYWSPVNSGKAGDEWAAVFKRKEDVRRIYTTRDVEEQDKLLREYKVRYIIVGELERVQYPGMTLGTLQASHLHPIKTFGAMDNPRSVVIYEYRP